MSKKKNKKPQGFKVTGGVELRQPPQFDSLMDQLKWSIANPPSQAQISLLNAEVKKLVAEANISEFALSRAILAQARMDLLNWMQMMKELQFPSSDPAYQVLYESHKKDIRAAQKKLDKLAA